MCKNYNTEYEYRALFTIRSNSVFTCINHFDIVKNKMSHFLWFSVYNVYRKNRTCYARLIGETLSYLNNQEAVNDNQ